MLAYSSGWVKPAFVRGKESSRADLSTAHTHRCATRSGHIKNETHGWSPGKHQAGLKRLSHRQLTSHWPIFNKGKERRPKDDVDSPSQAVILGFPGKDKIHPPANHKDSKDVHAPFGESPHEDANLPRIHVWTLSRDKEVAKGQRDVARFQVSSWYMGSSMTLPSEHTAFPTSSAACG